MLNKFITSKDLLVAKDLFRNVSKRELQHDFNRRFITPSIWKVEKDHIQTTATRSFKRLQQAFTKELSRIITLLVYKDYTIAEARRVSKQIFKDFYKKAYVLGIKASGSGMSNNYTLFSNIRSSTTNLDKEEEKWSEAASQSELFFWNRLLKNITNNSSLILYTDRRISMYIKTLEAHFDAGRVVGSPYNSVVYWTKTRDHSNCPGCTYMAKISPIPKESLVTTPRAGMCSCLFNCKCKIKIMTKSPEEVRIIRTNSPSKEEIVKQMTRLKYN